MSSPDRSVGIPGSAAQPCTQAFPTDGLFNNFRPAQHEWVITYHEIVPSPSQYLYRLTDAQFQEHLSLFSSTTWRSIRARKPLITFDDGHRSNYDHAFPLLEKFSIRAIFFVLAGRIGTTEYISWDQAREVARAGHQVQSHGWSHRLLTQCNTNELERELVWSKRELEDRIGVEVVSLSVPGGRWDSRVLDACCRAGYRWLYHSNPWSLTKRSKGLCLNGRHMITQQVGIEGLQKLASISRSRRFYSRIRHGAKESVRITLGDPLYHKLWCWLAKWKPEEGVEVEVDAEADRNENSGNT